MDLQSVGVWVWGNINWCEEHLAKWHTGSDAAVSYAVSVQKWSYFAQRELWSKASNDSINLMSFICKVCYQGL